MIPVYTEEGILREAVTELVGNIRTLKDELHEPGMTFEVILAENGSKDATAELARHLAEEFPEVRTFSLVEGQGGENQMIDPASTKSRFWNFLRVKLY